MSDETRPAIESAKAARAFAEYLGLGSGRTLRALAEAHVQRGYYKTANQGTDWEWRPEASAQPGAACQAE